MSDREQRVGEDHLGGSALICAGDPFLVSGGIACFKILSFSFEIDSSSRNTHMKCQTRNACRLNAAVRCSGRVCVALCRVGCY